MRLLLGVVTKALGTLIGSGTKSAVSQTAGTRVGRGPVKLQVMVKGEGVTVRMAAAAATEGPSGYGESSEEVLLSSGGGEYDCLEDDHLGGIDGGGQQGGR